MSQLVLFLTDIAAVSVLVFGLYFRRHRRRDLVAAYLCVNVGVLAVASSLSFHQVSAGWGLGLFGVLSIIRLRSTEIDQHEVAYYFASLALGILGALTPHSATRPMLLMLLVLGTVYLTDHPRLFPGYAHHIVLLDTAVTDQTTLIARLETLLHAQVHSATAQRVDLVNDTTLVDVRFTPLTVHKVSV